MPSCRRSTSARSVDADVEAGWPGDVPRTASPDDLVGAVDPAEAIATYGRSERRLRRRVSPIGPEALEKLTVFGARGLVLPAFAHAEAWQRRLVSDYARRMKADALRGADRIIILDRGEIIDGHHRVVAAIRSRTTLWMIDMADDGVDG